MCIWTATSVALLIFSLELGGANLSIEWTVIPALGGIVRDQYGHILDMVPCPYPAPQSQFVFLQQCSEHVTRNEFQFRLYLHDLCQHTSRRTNYPIMTSPVYTQPSIQSAKHLQHVVRPSVNLNLPLRNYAANIGNEETVDLYDTSPPSITSSSSLESAGRECDHAPPTSSEVRTGPEFGSRTCSLTDEISFDVVALSDHDQCSDSCVLSEPSCCQLDALDPPHDLPDILEHQINSDQQYEHSMSSASSFTDLDPNSIHTADGVPIDRTLQSTIDHTVSIDTYDQLRRIISETVTQCRRVTSDLEPHLKSVFSQIRTPKRSPTSPRGFGNMKREKELHVSTVLHEHLPALLTEGLYDGLRCLDRISISGSQPGSISRECHRLKADLLQIYDERVRIASNSDLSNIRPARLRQYTVGEIRSIGSETGHELRRRLAQSLAQIDEYDGAVVIENTPSPDITVHESSLSESPEQDQYATIADAAVLDLENTELSPALVPAADDNCGVIDTIKHVTNSVAADPDSPNPNLQQRQGLTKSQKRRLKKRNRPAAQTNLCSEPIRSTTLPSPVSVSSQSHVTPTQNALLHTEPDFDGGLQDRAGQYADPVPDSFMSMQKADDVVKVQTLRVDLVYMLSNLAENSIADQATLLKEIVGIDLESVDHRDLDPTTLHQHHCDIIETLINMGSAQFQPISEAYVHLLGRYLDVSQRVLQKPYPRNAVIQSVRETLAGRILEAATQIQVWYVDSFLLEAARAHATRTELTAEVDCRCCLLSDLLAEIRTRTERIRLDTFQGLIAAVPVDLVTYLHDELKERSPIVSSIEWFQDQIQYYQPDIYNTDFVPVHVSSVDQMGSLENYILVDIDTVVRDIERHIRIIRGCTKLAPQLLAMFSDQLRNLPADCDCVTTLTVMFHDLVGDLLRSSAGIMLSGAESLNTAVIRLLHSFLLVSNSCMDVLDHLEVRMGQTVTLCDMVTARVHKAQKLMAEVYAESAGDVLHQAVKSAERILGHKKIRKVVRGLNRSVFKRDLLKMVNVAELRLLLLYLIMADLPIQYLVGIAPNPDLFIGSGSTRM